MEMYGTQFNGKGDHVHLDSSMDRGHISEEMYDDPRAVSEINLLQVIRRRLVIIVLVTIVVTGLATGFTFLQTPLYTASNIILVDEKGSDGSVSDPSAALALENITATLAEQVATRPVAEGVVQKLKLSTPTGTLLSNLSAEQVEDTLLIEVSYMGSNPQETQRIVNAVGTVFSERVEEEDLGGSGSTAHVVETAALPTSPVSPNPMRNMFLALAAGMMLGVGLAFLLEHLDDNWRSADEVERVSGAPNLGIIPAFKIVKNKRKGLLE
jgi:capsular polysaccharide biosynthesis protein